MSGNSSSRFIMRNIYNVSRVEFLFLLLGKNLVLSKFIWKGRMEGNVLFNNSLNTFYLRFYGVGHLVNDHSASESGNLLLPLQGLIFSISSKSLFICTISHTG